MLTLDVFRLVCLLDTSLFQVCLFWNPKKWQHVHDSRMSKTLNRFISSRLDKASLPFSAKVGRELWVEKMSFVKRVMMWKIPAPAWQHFWGTTWHTNKWHYQAWWTQRNSKYLWGPHNLSFKNPVGTFKATADNCFPQRGLIWNVVF